MIQATQITVEFTSDEVCDRAGVSYRQLDYWARFGVITPSIRDAGGQGKPRRWSEEDVVVVRVVGRLASMGAEGAALGAVVAMLRAHAVDAPISGYDWVTVEGDRDGPVVVKVAKGEPSLPAAPTAYITAIH